MTLNQGNRVRETPILLAAISSEAAVRRIVEIFAMIRGADLFLNLNVLSRSLRLIMI